MNIILRVDQSPPKCIRTANTFALSPEYVSEPQEVKFPVSVTVGPADKQPSHAYGYYYPPKVSECLCVYCTSVL